MLVRQAVAAGAPVALITVLVSTTPTPVDQPVVVRTGATALAGVVADGREDLLDLRVAADDDTTGVGPASTSGPDVVAPPAPPATSLAVTDLVALGVDARGLPTRVKQAYTSAAAQLAGSCGIRWELIAAIGRVESDHGRHGDSVVHEDGTVSPAIVGPRLDGSGGFAVIRDSDGGRYDGDAQYDEAVGPMQFLPSTWASYGVDGDRDGDADINDPYDAVPAAALYLCRYGAGRGGQELYDAIFAYNHADWYVREILALAAQYR